MGLENDVLSILDELEEIIDRSPKIPMTGKVLVDDAVIFELIDRIRAELPDEIRNAKWILSERQRLLDDAKTEADSIMTRGKSFVEKLTEENEVVKQAQTYAEEIIKQAQAYVREVKVGAVQYADNMLEHVEKLIQEDLQSLRRNREELRSVARREEREKYEKGE